mgnify:CR=1 FL=1
MSKRVKTIICLFVLVSISFISFSAKPAFTSGNNSFGITLSQFNCDMDFLDDDQQIQIADAIMKGQLLVYPVIGEGPAFSLETLDWNIQYSESPSTFQLYLQSLNCIKYLARGYELTGDQKYLRLGKEFISSWEAYKSDEVLSKGNPYVWYDHGTALRAENLIYFALVCEQANCLDAQFSESIRSLIKRHGEFLSDNAHYTKNHNHGIFQDRALIYIAYFINDEDSERYIDLAKKRLESQKNYAFNSEMVHVENSPGYQIGVLNLFRTISEFLIQFKDPFGEKLYQDILQSAEFMAYIHKPNGLTAEIGDTNGAVNIQRNTNNSLTQFKNEHLIYAATQGTQGTSPQNNTAVFLKSGYFIAREHWDKEDFNQATWSMLKAGYSSKTHKHADDISFMLYSKGYDIFVDPGWYNYITGNEYRDYFVSSRAHNTVIVDGKTYSTTEENSSKTGLLKYKIGEDYDYALGFNDMYRGVNIDRHYYEMNDSILLYDNIKSDQTHIYSQLFHLSENMKIISASDQEVKIQLADTGYIVRIRQLGAKPSLNIIHGDYQNSEYGYISRKMNHLDLISTLKYDVKASNVDFITLITIEDAQGLVKLTKSNAAEQVYLPANHFLFDQQKMQLNAGQIRINLQERQRFYPDKISMQLSGRHIKLQNLAQTADGLFYAWYIVSKDGRVTFKSDYSESSDLEYDLNGESEYFVKAYVKSKLGQRKSAIVAALHYDPLSQSYQNVTDQYPYLNLAYNGQEFEKIDKRNYIFKVNFDYSWNYMIKWYIYRNGGYYDSLSITDKKELAYTFDKPGKYTVMYYLTTLNGDNEFWNFEQIGVGE